MSIQVPPTNTTTPVYNPIFYVNPTASSGIDVAFLDANYLKFPTAQGSEDFTNGLFSTDTIDFNSATGANRAITNVSKTEFSDILGNALYTASIEENSTAIGIYDGGLIINSSNSINLVGTNILANGLPVGTGGGNVSTTANNTFLTPATTQTFNNQNIIISSGGTIEIGGFAGGNPTPSYIYFPTTFPTGSSGNNGLAYFWNNSDGGGEVSMICYAQGAGGGTTSAGGLQIYSVNSSPNAPQLLASFLYGGSSISTNPTIPTSTTIGTLTASQTATTYLLNTTYAPIASPALTGTPTSTTATAGDNSTNIATTAFVATSFAPLASPALTGTPTSTTATAGDSSTQIATTAFVATSFAPLASPGQLLNDNTAIGFETLPSFTTGDYNSAFGYQSLNSLTTGSSNTALGYQSLATLIGGDLNTSIGWGALAQNIADNNNTSIGYASGFNLVGNGTDSDFNIFVGWNAGYYQTSGSNNIAIGQFSGVDSTTPTISDTIAIGNITATAPLDIILGSSNINYVKFNCNAYNYELSAYNDNLGIANNDLYVNGFAQQPSTSTPTYLPTSYGTFYNNGGLPYFAYNNAGTITSQQLTATTFTLTATPNTTGGNTFWTTTPTLTQTINSNSFYFTFYTNITNTTTTTSSSVLSASGNYISGYGTAILQNYISTTSPSTTYNGYIFTIINSNGLNMTTQTSILPNPLPSFFVTDGDYFYNNSINLIFKCIKIY